VNAWAVPLRILAAVAMVAYPAVVWQGLATGSPRQVAIVLLAVMTPAMLLKTRGSRTGARVRGLAAVPATILAVLLAAAVLDGGGLILLTPVAANAVLLLSFGLTLRRGSTPMIERFARLQEPDLSPPKQAWCRTWTKVWCGFFVANGAIAAWLERYADLESWAFYNGLLAYALIGSLLALEWLLRRARFRDAPRDDAS